jgi:hypothetical protein
MPESGCRDLNPGPLDPQISEAERCADWHPTSSLLSETDEVEHSSPSEKNPALDLRSVRGQSPPTRLKRAANGPALRPGDDARDLNRDGQLVPTARLRRSVLISSSDFVAAIVSVGGLSVGSRLTVSSGT